MNIPSWRLDWFRDRLLASGARKVPDTRRGMRLLHEVYSIAMGRSRRKLRGAIARAGTHGALAARLGEIEREIGETNRGER